MTAVLAAQVFTALVIMVALFQLGLAAGLPWGALAWGGRHPGRLPTHLRAASLVSVAVLAVLGTVVMIRAGIAGPEWQPLSRTLVWGVVAYSIVGVVLNAITPSRWERIVWLPVALALLACSLVVAVR